MNKSFWELMMDNLKIETGIADNNNEETKKETIKYIDDKLLKFATKSHIHDLSEVKELEDALNNKLDKVSFANHKHDMKEIEGLNDEIDRISDITNDVKSQLNVLNNKSIPNATTNNKGVVQIGSGLKVNDGIVSVDTTSVTTTTLSAESPLSDYSDGIVVQRISSNRNDANYKYYHDIVKELIGTDMWNHADGSSLRFFSTTSKSKFGADQNVDVTLNTTGNFYLLFRLFRTYAGEKWTDWKVTVYENYGKGSPEGKVIGVYGAKYTDVDTNITYVKKGNVAYINTSNWVAINEPPPRKEFLHAIRTNNNQELKVVNAPLNFNSVNDYHGIEYANGFFTLQENKTYRITMNVAMSFTSNNGILTIQLSDTSNQKVGVTESVFYPSTYTLPELSNGVYDTIFTPKETGQYKLAVSSLNETVKLTYKHSSLIIQEI